MNRRTLLKSLLCFPAIALAKPGKFESTSIDLATVPGVFVYRLPGETYHVIGSEIALMAAKYVCKGHLVLEPTHHFKLSGDCSIDVWGKVVYLVEAN